VSAHDITPAVISARLRAHRWVSTLCCAVVLGAAGWATRDETVDIPLVEGAVPARLLTGIAASVVALLPLYSAFPELEASLAREPWLRLARVCSGPGLAGLAALPAWLDSAVAGQRHAELVLGCTLLVAGLLSVVAVGDVAWGVPLTLGVTALIADTGPGYRVTAFLASVPLLMAVGALIAAAAVYVSRGPSRRRR
jgi:hypothetical protein